MSPDQTLSVSDPSENTRYGLFGLLDHRSSYGQGVFPEPFLVDDSDLEVNEARLDWLRSGVAKPFHAPINIRLLDSFWRGRRSTSLWIVSAVDSFGVKPTEQWNERQRNLHFTSVATTLLTIGIAFAGILAFCAWL
jgi:hypothetical protein